MSAPAQLPIELRLEMSIGPDWKNVEMLRTAVLNCILTIAGDEDVSQSIGTIASELLENAVKYGRWGEDGRGVLGLHIAGNATNVSIGVTCPVDETNLLKLESTLQWIQRFPSAREAYLEKMQEVAGNEESFGGMGLVRIMYEGNCSLQVERIGETTLRVRANAPMITSLAS